MLTPGSTTTIPVGVLVSLSDYVTPMNSIPAGAVTATLYRGGAAPVSITVTDQTWVNRGGGNYDLTLTTPAVECQAKVVVQATGAVTWWKDIEVTTLAGDVKKVKAAARDSFTYEEGVVHLSDGATMTISDTGRVTSEP